MTIQKDMLVVCSYPNEKGTFSIGLVRDTSVFNTEIELAWPEDVEGFVVTVSNQEVSIGIPDVKSMDRVQENIPELTVLLGDHFLINKTLARDFMHESDGGEWPDY